MTLVDSNVILDLFTADERWLEWSSSHFMEEADSGPVAINPVIFAECAYGYATQLHGWERRLPTSSVTSHNRI